MEDWHPHFHSAPLLHHHHFIRVCSVQDPSQRISDLFQVTPAEKVGSFFIIVVLCFVCFFTCMQSTRL